MANKNTVTKNKTKVNPGKASRNLTRNNNSKAQPKPTPEAPGTKTPVEDKCKK